MVTGAEAGSRQEGVPAAGGAGRPGWEVAAGSEAGARNGGGVVAVRLRCTPRRLYIYIERETERERDRETEIERERDREREPEMHDLRATESEELRLSRRGRGPYSR